MIEIVVDSELLEKAKNHYEYMNRMLNQWSFHDGSGNMIGALGECAVKQYYGDIVKFPEIWSPDYDMVWDSKWKIDVKSKSVNVKPQPFFNVSVSSNNGGAMGIKQKCDIYCFCHVASDYSMVWIDGFLTKKKFLKTAKFFKKGSLDTDHPKTNFHFKVDTYVTTIDKLQFPKI